MGSIPILLGGLFFLVCFVVALGYLVSAKRKDRSRGFRIGAMGRPGSLPLLPFLPPINPTFSSVSDTYQGTFGGGANTFVLRPDGTYDQEFVTDAGEIYVNRGKWGFSGSGSLYFNHLLYPVGGFGKPQKPRITNFGGAGIYLLSSDICFSEENNITLYRVNR